MIADPRALAARAADPQTRTLARLACAVTEVPWTLGPADLVASRAAGLHDEMILQTVLLSSFFGHLNRMADAVGIELDYRVQVTPPPAAPETPPYQRPAPADWPDPAKRRDLDVAERAGAHQALTAWRDHALERDAPLSRVQRAVLALAVAERLGDGETVKKLRLAYGPTLSDSAAAAALVATADEITLTPWRLGAGTVARLRAAGLVDDATVLDAIATGSGCTVFSRIAVALAALGRA